MLSTVYTSHLFYVPRSQAGRAGRNVRGVAPSGQWIYRILKLRAAIREIFSDERQAELLRSPHRQHATREHSHGRGEERHYVLTKLPKNSPLRKQ